MPVEQRTELATISFTPSSELIDQLTEWGEVTVRHDPTGALDFALLVRPTALERGDGELEATTYLLSAIARFRLYQLPAALEDIKQAETIFLGLSDQNGELRARLLRATITAMLGDVEAGEAALREGIEQCRAIGQYRYLCIYLGNLSGVLMSRNQFFEAIDILDEERDIEQTHGWHGLWTIASSNLTSCYLHLNDPEAALDIAGTALRDMDDNPAHGNDPVQQNVRPHLIHQMGVACEQLQRHTDAMTFYRQSVDAARNISDVRELGLVLFDAGRLARQIDRDDEARQHLADLVTLLQPPDGKEQDPPDPYLTLATAMLEDIEAAWTAETADRLQRLVDLELPPERDHRLHVYDALVTTLEGLGRISEAISALKAAAAFREQRWRDTMQAHVVASAKALQAREARERAEHERWRREELDRTLLQVRQLNAENESLVQQLSRQSEVLESLSLTDSLTGVLNRRAFDIRRQAEQQRAMESGDTLAIGLVDIDDFKAVNDQFSHAVGDEVLQAVASLLVTSMRREDTVARYGGEEFAVLLPGATGENARNIGDRARQAIRDHAWDRIAPGLAVTVSIGVWIDTAPTQASNHLDMADRLLYQAKREGKNRVCIGHD